MFAACVCCQGNALINRFRIIYYQKEDGDLEVAPQVLTGDLVMKTDIELLNFLALTGYSWFGPKTEGKRSAAVAR